MNQENINEEIRLDPEELLKMIQSNENRRGKGRLKIFLGMAAGVGKTYTMLEAAQKKMNEGVDVLVGNVETHGRSETARLLAPLKRLPLKEIAYKEKTFYELDPDEIIKLHPQLVLIDELAHTNVPGSKHVKRWQDVVEILEAGIDVFTTINIQHVESYKDIVEGIVGIKIGETVPDHLIARAADIELVDIPPVELLQRLKEGKVYTKDLGAVALNNFFQEDRLTALREIALRFTAEMVDLDLHDMVGTIHQQKVWRTRERLLVAVNHQPYMQQLIRSTRRLAVTLHAPWVVAYVDNGTHLSDEQSAVLVRNLALARELEAEVVTTQDSDVVEGIRRLVEQKKITQVIISKTTQHGLWGLFKRSLAERLSKACNVDVHIMRPSSYILTPKKKKKAEFSNIFSYLHILLWALALTGLNMLVIPYVGYKVAGSFFLVSILLLSFFFKRGPLMCCAVYYALVWHYYFVPQAGSLELSKPDVGSPLFLLTAFIIGILTNRVKTRQELLLKKERSTQAIYEIVREISAAPTSEQLFKAVKEKLGIILQGNCEILSINTEGELDFENSSSLAQDAKEKAVAQWVLEQGKEAGWSTTTLPSVKYLYIPLKGYKENVGVLAFRPFVDRDLLPEEANFLYTVSQQLAHFLERSRSEEKERRNHFFNQIEKIYAKVLWSISDELYRPLTIIRDSLVDCMDEEEVVQNVKLFTMMNKIEQKSKNLLQVAESARAMATLSGGFIAFKKQMLDIATLIHAAHEEIKSVLKNHYLKTDIDKNIPLISCDPSLMNILLHHLLMNAIQYSPPQSTITIEATLLNGSFILAVMDEGRGIPDEDLDLVFEKFYRVQGTVSTGLGLGLAIVKAITEIHHGTIRVQNRSTGGARFSLILPL